MRRYVVLVLFVFILAGSLSAAAATQHAKDVQLRGYVDPTQTADLPYRIPRLGVNADLLQYSERDLHQHLTWMQQANITWVRQFVYWDQLEPEEGVYQWQPWDELLHTLQDYPQLRLVVVFMRSPAWARTREVSTEPPDDPATLASFASAFAARYGEQIDHYQIWDEPNLDDAWGQRDPRPAEYAALLAAAYPAIHRADEDATVLAAALAPTTERGGANIADVLYLRNLYALGARDYFDATAAKPYGFNTTPDDRTVSVETLNFSRIIALREVMVANGDSRKALWASAWGWNALPDDWDDRPSIWGNVTEQKRIAHTLDALNRAEREWPWLGGMILTHWQPPVPDDDPLWGFSLIDQSGQPTRLWQSLTERPAQIAATNGLYHPRTEYARYSGLWTLGELGADIGWLSDSQLEFDFRGTDVALLLREGDYFAFLYPTVDGKPANQTPQDNQGNAYILLRSRTLEPELNLVPVSSGLRDEQHVLRIIADRGWDRWALAGYAVSNGNLALPYQQQIHLAILTAGIAFVGLIRSATRIPWRRHWIFLRKTIDLLSDTAQVIITIVTSLAMLVGLLLTWGATSPNLFRRAVLEPIIPIVLSGGLIAFEPGFLLSVVALLLLFVLIYHRLENGLLLILLYAPFFLFPVELYHFAFPMAELILLLTGAAWALRGAATWGRWRQSATAAYPLRVSWRLHPVDQFMLAWVGLGLLALLWSSERELALTEFRTLFLEPGLFYAILRTTVREQAGYRQLAQGFVMSGFLVASVSLLQYAQGAAIITAEDGVRRLAGIYGSPNNLALFLERVIPFALAFTLVPLSQARWRRWLMAVALLLMVAAMLLTQSTGGLLLGMPVGVAVALLLLYRRRAILPLLGLGGIGLIAALILLQVSPRFASLLDWSTGTNFMRLRVWESSLEMIAQQPLTGLGLDQFLYQYRAESIRPDAIADPDLSHPHQIVLDFWLRLGILGVILLIAWFSYTVRKIRHLQRRLPEGTSRALLAGTAGALGSLLAHGLIDNSIYVLDLAYVFTFLMAILAFLSDEAH